MSTVDLESTYEIHIYSRKNGHLIATAPAALEDRLSKYSWFVTRNSTRAEGRQFEVRTHVRKPDGPQTTVQLHRMIWDLLGRAPAKQIDHVDGNPLNNSVRNLRDGQQNGNQRNRGRQRSNTSGFVGVGWDRVRSMWRAYIRDGVRYRCLGHFSDISEAVRIRDRAAIELHGEFAFINIRSGAPAPGGEAGKP